MPVILALERRQEGQEFKVRVRLVAQAFIIPALREAEVGRLEVN